jgi:hypothetical protein
MSESLSEIVYVYLFLLESIYMLEHGLCIFSEIRLAKSHTSILENVLMYLGFTPDCFFFCMFFQNGRQIPVVSIEL